MSGPRPQGEPWQWGVVESAHAVRNATATPTEIVRSVLARIDDVEPAIAAFVSIDRDGALAHAEELTRQARVGEWQGPLHGVPVAIKDIFDIEGHRTGCGSPLYADRPAAEADADAVARLRAAGAVLVGKTATHELACGVYTQGTRNPWDLQRSCGGSSGGSGAAVAAGLAMAATGSDTGGSIRIPAAVCGVVGIKPTYGVVSRRGVAALAWSLDHVGPLARSVDDAAAVFEVLVDPAVRARLAAAPDPSDARSEGTVLGVPTDAVLSRVLPSVRAAFEEACAVLVDAGARLVEVSIPELEETLPLEFAIVAAEAASFHAEHLRTSAALIGPEIRALFQAGAILPSADYLLAQRLRSVLCSAVARTFDENGLDALCTPTLPLGPWRFEDTNLEIDGVEEAVIEAAVRTTAPFNLTGLPTVSVPMGLDERALPVGLQLVGRPYLDRTAIALARAYEQRRGPLAAVTPLHTATPGVPQTV